MTRTGWGIAINYSFGKYSSFLMADDTFYEGFKEKSADHGIYFVAGKKGIADKDIERIRERFQTVVACLNKDEKLDIRKELECIVNEPDIANPQPQPL